MSVNPIALTTLDVCGKPAIIGDKSAWLTSGVEGAIVAGYVERTYRERVASGDLVSFNATSGESDLLIRAETDLTDVAVAALRDSRRAIESWIERCPRFATALEPMPVEVNAPEIVRRMCRAARAADVGPMAAVAGAVAEHVGRVLLKHSDEVIVENGGDIFLASCRPRIVGIFAGDSPLSERIGILIPAEMTPLGVCTSSGTVGPSLSFGTADAAVVVSPNAALADAVATACGNRVHYEQDAHDAVGFAREVEGICQVVIAKSATLAVWGKFELVKLD